MHNFVCLWRYKKSSLHAIESVGINTFDLLYKAANNVKMKFAVGLLLLSLCIMNAQSFENHYGDVFGGVVLGTEYVKVVSEHLHPSYVFTYPKVIMTE